MTGSATFPAAISSHHWNHVWFCFFASFSCGIFFQVRWLETHQEMMPSHQLSHYKDLFFFTPPLQSAADIPTAVKLAREKEIKNKKHTISFISSHSSIHTSIMAALPTVWRGRLNKLMKAHLRGTCGCQWNHKQGNHFREPGGERRGERESERQRGSMPSLLVASDHRPSSVSGWECQTCPTGLPL